MLLQIFILAVETVMLLHFFACKKDELMKDSLSGNLDPGFSR